jgi:hypothetical protein
MIVCVVNMEEMEEMKEADVVDESVEEETPTKWLIGELVENISENYLQTYGEVIRYYYFHAKVTAPANSMLCNIIAEKLIAGWTKAGLSTKTKRSVVALIQKFVKRYTMLLKNRSISTSIEEKKRSIFCDQLPCIFDLTCNGLDACSDKLAPKKVQTDERMEVITEVEMETEDVVTETSDCEWEDSTSKFLKDDSGCRKSLNNLQAIIKSPAVTSVMDRLNLSDRDGVMMIGAMASEIGDDIEEGTLSRSSLRRYRKKNRADISENIKNTTEWGDVPVVIHWDGKKLSNSTNKLDPKTKIERHGVTATGNTRVHKNKLQLDINLPFFTKVLLVKNY